MTALFHFAYLAAWMLIGTPFLAAVGFLATYLAGRARGGDRGWMLIAGCVFAGIFILALVLYRAMGIRLLPL